MKGIGHLLNSPRYSFLYQHEVLYEAIVKDYLLWYPIIYVIYFKDADDLNGQHIFQ